MLYQYRIIIFYTSGVFKMSRVDGKKVVAVCTLGITAVLAVGQVYAPFFMDRNSFTSSSSETERRDAVASAMRASHNRSTITGTTTTEPDSTTATREQPPSAKSMWQNMKRKDL